MGIVTGPLEPGRAERRAEQLQHALDSRVVIEQAKGVLAERLGIGVEEAFERIRRHARSHSQKVGETCRAVVESGLTPV